MQVGLQTSTLANTGGLASPSSIKQQALANTAPVSSKPAQTISDYPASPLLTTRPQRYSVQLNDQLTTLQQADSYLGQLEQSLLDFRHAALSGGRRSQDGKALQKQTRALQQQLDGRTRLSGGSVDRQLNSVLQGPARVTFRAPALAQVLSGASASDSIMFSVQDGQKKRLSAVSVTEDADPRQYATQVNNALRRLGIETHAQAQDVTFSTTESQFSQLSRTLTMTPAGGAAHAISVEPEPSQSEKLSAALNSGHWGTAQPLVQTTLSQLSEQRQQLAQQQEKARQLIDGMARFPESQSAEKASAALTSTLDQASHQYDVLAQAINGQANLSRLTVRSLLR